MSFARSDILRGVAVNDQCETVISETLDEIARDNEVDRLAVLCWALTRLDAVAEMEPHEAAAAMSPCLLSLVTLCASAYLHGRLLREVQVEAKGGACARDA